MVRLLSFALPLRWRRFAKMEANQHRLLVEAGVRLATAALRVHLQPFQKAIQSGALPLGARSGCDPEAIVRAIRWAAAVLPFRIVCLQEGLACQSMLRIRGVDARLRYGAAVGRKLEAHVWVTVGDRVVIGEEEASRFKPVACFPA